MCLHTDQSATLLMICKIPPSSFQHSDELRQSHVDFKTPFYWTLPCLRDPSMARAHMDNFPYRVLSHSTNTRYNLTQKQYVKQDTKVQQFKKCTTL